MTKAKLGFVGIGVKDIKKSTEFYLKIFNLDGTKSTVNETVLGYEGEDVTLLILMHWPHEDRKYDGDNTKVVFEVDDAADVINKIRGQGGKIDREAIPHYTIEGGLVGLGRDPDNYVVEVVQWKVD